jgi:adenosylcobyric acid synthase
MALNSAVTPEGGEIGRAQAVQADACGIPPHTDMNPILLKPTCDLGSQVIVQGKVVGTMRVAEYTAYKPTAFARAKESYARLAASHDVVVIEGAGSIAEINLKAHDIANLAVAEMADCPVILVADIDRGGVFAQLIGTWELLEPHEQARIIGFVINKFRGDASLLTPGLTFIEQRTRRPVLGVIPWLTDLRLPAEDSVALQKQGSGTRNKASAKINIGVVKLPRISNFTDFDSLETEPDVTLHYVEGPQDLDRLDALILPGSKATIADLYFLMERGLFNAIRSYTGPVIGICGGYQMLGRRVLDPDHLDADITEAEGLGLLDTETTMLPEKETHQVQARLTGGAAFFAGCGDLSGYEIHLGRTVLGRGVEPFMTILRRSGTAVAVADGAVSRDGRVCGTYLHGIFDNADFRHAFLNRLRYARGLKLQRRHLPAEDPFDRLANHLQQHLDYGRILAGCGVHE